MLLRRCGDGEAYANNRFDNAKIGAGGEALGCSIGEEICPLAANDTEFGGVGENAANEFDDMVHNV